MGNDIRSMYWKNHSGCLLENILQKDQNGLYQAVRHFLQVIFLLIS